MLYLWDWIKDKQILRSDEWLQISMLDNMVLGYSSPSESDAPDNAPERTRRPSALSANQDDC